MYPLSSPADTESGPRAARTGHPRRWPRAVGAALLAGSFGGCTQTAAPAVPLMGAYFPSWLLCTLAGVLTAIVVRIVFVWIRLDDVLPARLLVYLAVATVAGFLVSILAFGR